MTDPTFDAEYYTSNNYENYLERTFDALADDLENVLMLRKDDIIIDFGCGFGGLVNALHARGYSNTLGTDISNWAIDYGKAKFPNIKYSLQYYNRNVLDEINDHVIALDVLEHMPEHEIETVLNLASRRLQGYFIARMPVSNIEGEAFVLDVSNKDRTHITCHPKKWWYDMFRNTGYILVGTVNEAAMYDSPGVLVGVWRAAHMPERGAI